MKSILAVFLFVWGVIYAQAQTSLPFGSTHKFQTYLMNRVYHISAQVWIQNPNNPNNWWIHRAVGVTEWTGDIETAARQLYKEVLDSLHTEGEHGYTYISYCAVFDRQSYLILGSQKNPRFKLEKNANGEFVVPDYVYDLGWVYFLNHLLYPVSFTDVTHVRIAVQNPDGTCAKVYDTADINNEFELYFPGNPGSFQIRHSIATSGKPGLVTITSTDKNGMKRVRFFSLATGEELPTTKVIPEYDNTVTIITAGNPEKDLLLVRSEDLKTWKTVGEIPSTTIGVKQFNEPACAGAFYKTRPKQP